MRKLSFRVRGFGVKKGKRKETGFNIEIERIDYVDVTDEMIEKYKLLAKETADKNIKNHKMLHLMVRYIDETIDEFGTIESYSPFDDKQFPL